MLSSVLRSKRAAQVNIAIMRTFVRLREMLATHKDLARKLNEMERKYDAQFKVVFDAIRKLMEPPPERFTAPAAAFAGLLTAAKGQQPHARRVTVGARPGRAEVWQSANPRVIGG